MNLTTTARVKRKLQPEQSVGSSIDTILGEIITDVSRQVETYCARGFEWKARTEFFDVNDGQKVFELRAFPARTVSDALTDIASVSVYNDTARSFTSTIDSSLWTIDQRYGRLIFDTYTPLRGPQVLKIVYTGGLNSSVTSDSTFVSAFPDIAQVVDIECVRVYRIMSNPSATAISIGSGNVAFTSDGGFLPSTLAVLNKYRRTAIG